MSQKKPAEFRSALNPRPPVIVSCRGKDGKDNALVVVYACNCSYDPPMIMVGIVPSRHSHHMVKETGVFVVNLANESMREQFSYLGSHSGRDEDKIKKLGLSVANGVEVDAPILLDAPVSIECRVTGSVLTGSHEMFIGEVVYVHADEGLVDDKGKIDFSSIDFLKV